MVGLVRMSYAAQFTHQSDLGQVYIIIIFKQLMNVSDNGEQIGENIMCHSCKCVVIIFNIGPGQMNVLHQQCIF